MGGVLVCQQRWSDERDQTRIIPWSFYYGSYDVLVPLRQAMGGVYVDHHS